MTSCFIYCRVSSSAQDYERQEISLRALASRSGLDVLGVFAEKASTLYSELPERKRLIKAVMASKAKYILVEKANRLGRTASNTLELIRQLAAKKIFLMNGEGLVYNPTTSEGNLMLTILTAIDEYERDTISERARRGMVMRKLKKQRLLDAGRIEEASEIHIGRKPGCKDNKTREITPQAIALYRLGWSIAVIADRLKTTRKTIQIILDEQFPERIAARAAGFFLPSPLENAGALYPDCVI